MKKVLSLWDVIWINVTAVIGLRWLPMAASYGAASIFLWIVAALFFFLPLAFVSTELATTWPDQGGIYVWIKKAFGEKWGFLVSWFYWVNSFFYGPSLLTFTAVAIAYIFNPKLATNQYFIASIILIGFWSITWLNLRGMRTFKWLPQLSGSLGTLLPGILIVGLGFASAFLWKQPIGTDYSLHNWLPHLNTQASLALFSTLMFSMSGIELTPTMAGETKNPRKIFPRAAIISVILILGVYIAGTIAINLILAPEKIGAASGLFEAMNMIGITLHLPIIVAIVALMLTIGNIGGVAIWVVAPIKMLFESTKQGVFPKSLTTLNKNEMPAKALLVQAIIVTVVVLSITFSPSINVFYETLVITAIIIYFIPYLFMFAAFLTLRKTHPHIERPYRVPGGIWTARLIAAIGLGAVLFGIAIAFLSPPSDIKTAHDILIYRLELLMGPVICAGFGYWLYINYERKNKQVEKI